MPPFLSTSKVVESLISRRGGIRHAIKYATCNAEPWKYRNGRHLRCIPGVETSSTYRLFDQNRKVFSESFRDIRAVQSRRFLGCGDGEEAGVLSKIYEERRVMG